MKSYLSDMLRCRNCGHTAIEHRGDDGACPTCDEDAAVYRAENQPAEVEL